MPVEPVFTITYWGTTGTMAAPLRPCEVTDKIVRAIHRLLEQGRLAELKPGAGAEEAIRRQVESLPFPVRTTYGGNTTCVQVGTPDALIILDSGSGLRELGISLTRRWNAAGYDGLRTAHVLITHPHMDHTFATPYMAPYFDPRNHFTIWGTAALLRSLEAVLRPDSPLSHTYFPPTYDMMQALRGFQEIKAGDQFAVGDTRVRTYALNHPGGCLAFRLENAGRAYVFATDHEHQQVPDMALAEFARGADILYTEGQYLRAEYEGKQAIPGDVPLARRGWGHSPVESCVATAVAAGVKVLHLGHREPMRPDDKIAELEAYAQQLMREELVRAGRAPDSCTASVAYEGMTVKV
jgi:phosphoribosyl 1,2-cyclic phosphodiesterase